MQEHTLDLTELWSFMRVRKRFHLLPLIFLVVLPVFVLAAPAWADHGGPLASAPMSPTVVALLAGGLAFVTVLLLVIVWRLIVRPGRRAE